MQSELGHPLNSMFGVGLDWQLFRTSFCYRDNKWQPQDPVEVNKYSAERFLWAHYNLGQKGNPFSSEYLADDFGFDTPFAQGWCSYALRRNFDNRSCEGEVFFQSVEILFGEVCGYDVDTHPTRSRNWPKLTALNACES